MDFYIKGKETITYQDDNGDNVWLYVYSLNDNRM